MSLAAAEKPTELSILTAVCCSGLLPNALHCSLTYFSLTLLISQGLHFAGEDRKSQFSETEVIHTTFEHAGIPTQFYLESKAHVPSILKAKGVRRRVL